MTDDAWPPPPEGQRSAARHIKEAGVVLAIDHDFIQLDFVDTRRVWLVLAMVWTLVLVMRVADVASIHPLAMLIAHFMRRGLTDAISLLTVPLYWYVYSMYGRVTIRSNGTIHRAGQGESRGTIKYIEVTGRSSIRLGMEPWPNRRRSVGWLGHRKSTRNDIVLGSVRNRAAAKRIADIIGEFLCVPVIDAG